MKKTFTLVSHDRRFKFGVSVGSVAEVIRKARTFFNLGVDESIEVVREEDGTRVTEDGFLLPLEGHTKLMILRSNTQWMQQPVTLGEQLEKINIHIVKAGKAILATDGSGHRISCLHPKLPILAFAGYANKVILFKAKRFGTTFSNWTKSNQFGLQSQFLKKVSTLEWNTNGSQLAAGCADGTIIVWSYPNGDVLFKIKHCSQLGVMVWNPFRPYMLASFDDYRNVLIWNTGTSGEASNLCSIDLHQQITAITWVANNQVAIGFKSGLIEICEIIESQSIRSYRVSQNFRQEGEIVDLAWNERLQLLAGASNKCAQIWSKNSIFPVHSVQFASLCNSLVWHPTVRIGDGTSSATNTIEKSTLICGLINGLIVVWNPLETDIARGKKILRENSFNCMIDTLFSSDGRFLASMNEISRIVVWATDTWLPVFSCLLQVNGNYIQPLMSWMYSDPSVVATYNLAIITYNSRTKIQLLEGAVPNPAD